MKEFLTKHWKNILLIVFVLFSLNKCTVSCNRANKISKLNTVIEQKDSIITASKDSIKTLNATINVYNEKINGMENASKIQDEAMRQISNAKKNIQVSVKK